MERDSFVFYKSWLEAIKNLPREIQGEVLTAIIEYGLTGVTTEPLKPITSAMLAMVRPQIDINNARYENGKKGGRPLKDVTKIKPNGNQDVTEAKPNGNQDVTEAKPNGNQDVTEAKPNVYVYDNENDNNPLPPRRAYARGRVDFWILR